MSDPQLVERLSKLKNLETIPAEELEWLAAHGDVQIFTPGDSMAPQGQIIENLYIILSGSIAIRVDRGAGPRFVIRWTEGDPTGMLPYSRMKASPGNTFAEIETEALAIHQSHFPELIHKCPVFTARTVHGMLDRARSFRTGDLQDEKMISLGKLAAGLAHELNNPASAILRTSKQLVESQSDADDAARTLGATGLSPEQFEWIERFRKNCSSFMQEASPTPLEKLDLEDEIADWLKAHGLHSPAADLLVDSGVHVELLNDLYNEFPPDAIEPALQWIVTGCTMNALSSELENAANRIYELVSAVKKFSYMDNLAGSESVEVESGIRDTLSMLAAKIKTKSAAVELNIDNDLPLVLAKGAELNQVWINVIENALDAIDESGQVEIEAREEADRIVVRIIDNGQGIPESDIDKIFDAFFTTKAPGKGTGLGLEIARRIVRRHHGEITAESEPGRTVFQVSLLAANKARSVTTQTEQVEGSAEPFGG